MNIQTFIDEYDNLSKERQRSFANRLMNELTKRINQEYTSDGYSDTFVIDLLPILNELEANDFFGTEGFDA